MAVALDRVPQGSRPRIGAGEDLHLAATVIVEPLDAPLAGQLAVLENFGRLWHRGLLHAGLTPPSAFLPRQQEAGLAGWLGARVRYGPWGRRLQLLQSASQHPNAWRHRVGVRRN